MPARSYSLPQNRPNPRPWRHLALQNPSNFRLLKLIPAENPNDGLHCRLLEISPTDAATEEYEALSWTWDSDESTRQVIIDQDDKAYTFSISDSLFEALQTLRYRDKARTLWIDRICVNQKDKSEKNHQIPIMPKIYGNAKTVCIWLGSATDDSDEAIDFIEKINQNIWNFDILCKKEGKAGHSWNALFKMIMRRWFSRRWIVQEIALANDAVIYCGSKTISWKKFTDAVSLFVETERVTHRLSEIMKQEEIADYIPDLFENIAHLSATLLVETTNFLYRKKPDGGKEHLLGLEYLVSRLSIFNTSEPPDAVYALLAIAKDARPRAIDEKNPEPSPAERKATILGREFGIRTFHVDYGQDYAETCKDFLDF